jgi:hypothetical protein
MMARFVFAPANKRRKELCIATALYREGMPNTIHLHANVPIEMSDTASGI